MLIREFIEKGNTLVKENNIKSLGEFLELWEEHYSDENIKLVSSAQDPLRHRWFEVATDVYMLEDGFVGVTGGSVLYSEAMTWQDTNISIEFHEYEAFSSIKYRYKITN